MRRRHRGRGSFLFVARRRARRGAVAESRRIASETFLGSGPVEPPENRIARRRLYDVLCDLSDTGARLRTTVITGCAGIYDRTPGVRRRFRRFRELVAPKIPRPGCARPIAGERSAQKKISGDRRASRFRNCSRAQYEEFHFFLPRCKNLDPHR